MYVRITDEVGNVTYINSSMLVIYTTVENKQVEYIKNSSEDLIVKIKFNANTVKDITDENRSLTRDEDYWVIWDAIVFKSSYLEHARLIKI